MQRVKETIVVKGKLYELVPDESARWDKPGCLKCAFRGRKDCSVITFNKCVKWAPYYKYYWKKKEGSKNKKMKDIMKDGPMLIGSAVDEKSIIGIIARYFYGNPEIFAVKGSEVWHTDKAVGGEKKLNGFQVRVVKGRYRFEAL